MPHLKIADCIKCQKHCLVKQACLHSPSERKVIDLQRIHYHSSCLADSMFAQSHVPLPKPVIRGLRLINSERLLTDLEVILCERGMDLSEWLNNWDREAGYELGRTRQMLAPENEIVLTRNVRQIADRLGMDGNELFEIVVSTKLK